MIEAEYHPEMLLVLPQFTITKGLCDDPSCPANHWRVSIGWLVDSVHFYF